MTRRITRRSFLRVALSTGAAAAFPLTAAGKDLLSRLSLASPSGAEPKPLPGGPFFLSRTYLDRTTGNSHDLYAIADTICDRIIPTDPLGPGARQAAAVNYIDIFMGAFELPTSLASNPAIYLSGPYSGRWASGDPTTGAPGSVNVTPDDFETGSQIQFLGLTPLQALAWYLRIYGSAPPGAPSWVSSAWLNQTTGSSPLILGTQNLRELYRGGLSAFDDWSEQNYGTGFAQASEPQQDALLLLASNPVLAAASENNFPTLPAPLLNPVPPAAAAALFGVIVLHTIQGTYCLPEYSGGSDKTSGGQVTWQSIGFDGDTQPLGNSIYDKSLTSNVPLEPGNQWTNHGFGGPPDSGLYIPSGAYREYRPVSYPDIDSDQTKAPLEELQELVQALEKAGAKVTTFVSGKAGR